MTDLLIDLNPFVDERIKKAYNGDPASKQDAEAANDVWKKLRVVIGGNQEARELLFELEGAFNMASGSKSEAAYLQGFYDGLTLMSEARKAAL